KMAHDHVAERAREQGRERVAEQLDRPRLHQHHDARRSDDHRRVLPGAAAEPARKRLLGGCFSAHLRTAPKVMPRRRCRRSRIVKTTIGITNSVVAAATAGQSWPPSPMMNGMNGGIVWAAPLVSSTAKAYSFHAKIRQKIAVAAIPVTAW